MLSLAAVFFWPLWFAPDGFLYRANFDPDSAQAPLLRRCLEALVKDLVVPAEAPSGAADA